MEPTHGIVGTVLKRNNHYLFLNIYFPNRKRGNEKNTLEEYFIIHISPAVFDVGYY